MTIAFYLGPLKGGAVKADNVEKGNPGIGGTQYCMLELAHYLNAQKNFTVYIIAARPYALEGGLRFVHIAGDSDVCEAAKNCSLDILVLSQFSNKDLEADIKKIACKVIIWSHNYIYSDFCDFISTTNSIKANVFVGKQQYDRYIDDNVISKSTYIYNMFSDNTPVVERENDSKTVVYMGALIDGKGFAELCSIWPSIIKQVPDARLLVLGSGALYGDSVMGQYGLASKEYESKFIPYITDENGAIIESVKFLGVVGDGKTDIFRKASVGVVNPSGRTETFGMGVVEMAEAMLPVVTIGKNGYFDTVVNGQTGILSSSLSNMAKDIVFLLKNPDINLRYGKSAKERLNRYKPDTIGKQWDKLLTGILNDDYQFPNYMADCPYSNNHKWVRVLINKLRFRCRLKFLPSFIKIESFVAKRIR